MRRTIVLLLAALAALAVVRPARAQKFLPKSIQFKGAPEFSDQELMAAAQLEPGMVLDYAGMNEHAKLLMDTGVISSLAFRFDGQDLIFTLTPSTDLYSVRLENLPFASGKDLDARLHRQIPLYHGKVPAEGGIADTVRQALEQMLQAQGVKASIVAAPISDPKLHKVTAIGFTILDPPVLVGEVQPDPASAALDPDALESLRKVVGSTYNIDGSPNSIETYLGNFYHDRGYLEVRAHASALPAQVSPQAIRVPFRVSVDPGLQYRLSQIRLAPGLLVSQADFDRQARTHPGDIADGQHAIENWHYISRQYHNKGYMAASVLPRPAFVREHATVAYTVDVEPGPVYTMGALRIENVSDDLRTLMLAAWKMPAGSVFNEGAILGFFASEENPTLHRLFASVECKYTLTLDSQKRTVDVLLRLEKRRG